MIELILREDVPSLGKAGQMVRVKPGYARNFLLPHGLAFEATDGNKKRIEAEGRSREAKALGERTEAQELAGRIEAATLNFTAKAGEVATAGTWKVDAGKICLTYTGATPPGMTNPACFPVTAHKVGDKWTVGEGDNKRTVELVAGVH